VRSAKGLDFGVPSGTKVSFRNHAAAFSDRADTASLPLPDQRLIDLHAACCKVGLLSGAAEFFEKHDNDIEETKVLAEDGSATALLETALQRISACA
jgi:hypothetical protein